MIWSAGESQLLIQCDYESGVEMGGQKIKCVSTVKVNWPGGSGSAELEKYSQKAWIVTKNKQQKKKTSH